MAGILLPQPPHFTPGEAKTQRVGTDTCLNSQSHLEESRSQCGDKILFLAISYIYMMCLDHTHWKLGVLKTSDRTAPLWTAHCWPIMHVLMQDQRTASSFSFFPDFTLQPRLASNSQSLPQTPTSASHMMGLQTCCPLTEPLLYVRIHACMYVCVYVHMYMCECIYVCVYTCVHESGV